jgi:hypothetical protein
MSTVAEPLPGVYRDGAFFLTIHEPKKMAETPNHLFALARTVTLLRVHFQNDPSTGVIGDALWYYERGNPKAKRAPDLMVIRGLRLSQQSYRCIFQWEERNPPCFIMEIASDSTKRQDLLDKRALYERLKVREYLLFDPEWDGEPAGAIRLFRLVPKAEEPDWDEDNEIEYTYDEIPPEGNRYFSRELGLYFEAQGLVVDLLRPDGTRLLDLPNALARLDQVRGELKTIQSTLNQEMTAHSTTKQKLTTTQQKLSTTEQKLSTTEKTLNATAEELKTANLERTAALERARRLAEQLRQLGIDPDQV